MKKTLLLIVIGLIAGFILMHVVSKAWGETGFEAGAGILFILLADKDTSTFPTITAPETEEEKGGLFGSMKATEKEGESAMVEEDERWEPTKMNWPPPKKE